MSVIYDRRKLSAGATSFATGTFGVVRQVEHRDSGDRYALKTINKERLDEHQMKHLEAECEARPTGPGDSGRHVASYLAAYIF